MITFNRLARTKQLGEVVLSDNGAHIIDKYAKGFTAAYAYYALGKDSPSDAMTSAIQMVADLETPTRQCTRVAVESDFPFPATWVSVNLPGKCIKCLPIQATRERIFSYRQIPNTD